MFTNEEYKYSNIFEVLFNRMVKRRYKAGGLDEVRLAEAQVTAKSGPPSGCTLVVVAKNIIFVSCTALIVVLGRLLCDTGSAAGTARLTRGNCDKSEMKRDHAR